jgi:hypothetical protein
LAIAVRNSSLAIDTEASSDKKTYLQRSKGWWDGIKKAQDPIAQPNHAFFVRDYF